MKGHASSRPPNVVVILADDMGYGDIGAFGNDAVRTPNLDALAAEGVSLYQHYSASPVCAPARAALLTGRYPHRTGAIDTLEGRGLDRLALRELTLADLLKARGYATGLFGKWHLGALDPRYHPNARGFEDFAGFSGGWSDYYGWRLDYNGAFRRTDGRYLTDVFTEEAVGFIERHQDGPFFLHVTYNAPHTPLQVPEEDVAPFRETGRFPEGVARVYGMNRRMDAGIGRILEALERRGLARDTFVLFTSDNGPQFGVDRHSPVPDTPDADAADMTTTRFNAHFNGCKGNVYEGGIRVPAILRWPAGLEGRQRLDTFVHFTDWLPTLLAAAGLEAPGGVALDGGNVLPALRGEPCEVSERRFWQWNRYTPVVAGNAAMRDGPWKLLRPPIREAMRVAPEDLEMDRRLKREPESVTDICRDPEPERRMPEPPMALLFNVAEDPYEQDDLARSEPDRVARMGAALDAWFAEVEAERRSIRD